MSTAAPAFGTQQTAAAQRRPHPLRQTVLLWIPGGTPDEAFIQRLRAQLNMVFGPGVWLDVRTETDASSPGRCRYRLRGKWGRPTEFHDLLVQMFSVFQSDACDESRVT